LGDEQALLLSPDRHPDPGEQACRQDAVRVGQLAAQRHRPGARVDAVFTEVDDAEVWVALLVGQADEHRDAGGLGGCGLLAAAATCAWRMRPPYSRKLRSGTSKKT